MHPFFTLVSFALAGLSQVYLLALLPSKRSQCGSKFGYQVVLQDPLIKLMSPRVVRLIGCSNC